MNGVDAPATEQDPTLWVKVRNDLEFHLDNSALFSPADTESRSVLETWILPTVESRCPPNSRLADQPPTPVPEPAASTVAPFPTSSAATDFTPFLPVLTPPPPAVVTSEPAPLSPIDIDSFDNHMALEETAFAASPPRFYEDPEPINPTFLSVPDPSLPPPRPVPRRETLLLSGALSAPFPNGRLDKLFFTLPPPLKSMSTVFEDTPLSTEKEAFFLSASNPTSRANSLSQRFFAQHSSSSSASSSSVDPTSSRENSLSQLHNLVPNPEFTPVTATSGGFQSSGAGVHAFISDSYAAYRDDPLSPGAFSPSSQSSYSPSGNNSFSPAPPDAIHLLPEILVRSDTPTHGGGSTIGPSSRPGSRNTSRSRSPAPEEGHTVEDGRRNHHKRTISSGNTRAEPYPQHSPYATEDEDGTAYGTHSPMMGSGGLGHRRRSSASRFPPPIGIKSERDREEEELEASIRGVALNDVRKGHHSRNRSRGRESIDFGVGGGPGGGAGATASSGTVSPAALVRMESGGSSSNGNGGGATIRKPREMEVDTSKEYIANSVDMFALHMPKSATGKPAITEKEVREIVLDDTVDSNRLTNLGQVVWGKAGLQYSREMREQDDSVGTVYYFRDKEPAKRGETGKYHVAFRPRPPRSLEGPVVSVWDGRQYVTPATPTTFVHFVPGNIIVTPKEIMGTKMWWRLPICVGKHLKGRLEGGSWSGRYDAGEGQRPSRLVEHYATCGIRAAWADEDGLGQLARAIRRPLPDSGCKQPPEPMSLFKSPPGHSLKRPRDDGVHFANGETTAAYHAQKLGDLVGHLDEAVEQWMGGQSHEPTAVDETLALLSLANGGEWSSTRKMLVEVLQVVANLSVPAPRGVAVPLPRATYYPQSPESPPETAFDYSYHQQPTTAPYVEPPRHASDWAPPAPASTRAALPTTTTATPCQQSAPMYEENRPRVHAIRTNPAFYPVFPRDASGAHLAHPQAHAQQPAAVGPSSSPSPLSMPPPPPPPPAHLQSHPSKKQRSVSLPESKLYPAQQSAATAISVPALPVNGGPPTSARRFTSPLTTLASRQTLATNQEEIYILHDRDLQSRYPNDALEKCVTVMDLVDSKDGGTDPATGATTKLLKFIAADTYPRAKEVVVGIEVEGSVEIRVVDQEGRWESKLAMFRLQKGDFLTCPGVPVGSSSWWRHQECVGPHPSVNGKNCCHHGYVAPSVRAFANSLKTAGEDIRRGSIVGGGALAQQPVLEGEGT
ncbi:hypothetical protein MNV49_003169 [Pseudohyphozyma bogoriensis]|nr:hypothetical protein MNV49_003169 [Pseudohyphozyma bogoriensis]